MRFLLALVLLAYLFLMAWLQQIASILYDRYQARPFSRGLLSINDYNRKLNERVSEVSILKKRMSQSIARNRRRGEKYDYMMWMNGGKGTRTSRDDSNKGL